MKKTLVVIAVLVIGVGAVAATNDPTRVADAMADALKSQLADARSLRLHALVVGAGGEGVALVGPTPEAANAVRRGRPARDR